MVHETVDFVVVASLVVTDVNRLDVTVFFVSVKRLEEKDTKVAIRAISAGPFSSNLAILIGCDGLFSI